jgi:hypothetical protein
MNPLSTLLLAANEYRLINFDFPVLFEGEGSLNLPSQWVIAIGLIALAIGGGYLLANSTRQKDYGWKFAMVFTATLLRLVLGAVGAY